MNDWQSEFPSIEELLFGSIGSWLYLYYGHRKIFAINNTNLPTINLAFIHLSGSMAYIINHYLGETGSYMVWLILYSIIFYILYYTLIIRPILNIINRKKLIGLIIFGLVYTVVYILCETVAEIFLYGTLFRSNKLFDPLLPKIFIVIISCICWYIIILSHFSELKQHILCRKTYIRHQNDTVQQQYDDDLM